MRRPIEKVRIKVDNRQIAVTSGSTVAAALLEAGIMAFRRSVAGEPRAPLCGMGVCMECRVTIDGSLHTLACQTVVREGMTVETDG